MAREYLKKAAVAIQKRKADVEATVRTMLAEIADKRDEAVRKFARDLDKWTGEFRVSPAEIEAKSKSLSKVFKEDFATCHRNVTEFAKRQKDSIKPFEVELQPGVVLGQKLIPIGTVGCYVPGGKYPLISAAIMSVGTAKVAGVGHITACAPPRGADGIYPQTLYALAQSGADAIYCLGGVQAMASMAMGCLGMPKADMVTGPGNAFVAEAKRQIYGISGIDLLAGPTEILVIADDTADPFMVATDLLGQAEHGPTSPAIAVVHSEAFGREVIEAIDRLLETWPTAAVAGEAWRSRGEVVVARSREEAVAISDAYAPEHLEIMAADLDWWHGACTNYGSLFLGAEATVVYGDKAIGVNHVLPTERAARYTGGLWVGKFLRTLTYQRLTDEGTRLIAPVTEAVATAEHMLGHAYTARYRLDRLAETEG